MIALALPWVTARRRC